MVQVKRRCGIARIIEILPKKISREIISLLIGRGREISDISEIRLRKNAPSSILVSGERLPLFARVNDEEIQTIVNKLCQNSYFAYQDTIKRGYISAEGGIRVGVSGQAKSEGEKIIGIDDIGSLVFRIPTGSCEFAGELYRLWLDGGRQSTLIFSAPGEGKTTLLRSLARQMGTGREGLCPVVIDERREFGAEDYSNARVDILYGYGKREGIELALRTMSPDVILVDEIGSEEDEAALLSCYGAGVPVIATAHGDTLSRLSKRKALSRLFDIGMFGRFWSVKRTGDKFIYNIHGDAE